MLEKESRKFNVILFDLGDTLIYFDGSWDTVLPESSMALWQALLDQGLQIEKQTFLTEFTRRMQWYYQEREKSFVEYTSARMLLASLEKLGFPIVQDEIIKKALKAMYGVSQRYWLVEKEAHEVLTWLKNNHFRLGLISNASDADDVRALLTKHGLSPYFETSVISAEFGLRKPHEAIFQKAFKFFNEPLASYLMVGDRLGNDVLGAQKSKIHSAWIKRRGRTKLNQQYRHIIPDYEIENLMDLKELLADN